MGTLESILINEFYPRFCLETLAFHPTSPDREVAIPLVSFCDIPLSQIKNHAKLYGSYAIGLSKEWGLRQGITPVSYTHRLSPLPEAVYLMVEEIRTLTAKKDFWERNLYTASVYLKPYEGKLWRRDKYVDGIRFYDEREWRYVPTFDQTLAAGFDTSPVLRKADFLNQNLVDEGNKKLQRCKLSFEPNDIKYLIVKTEGELYDFATRVRQIKEPKYPLNDIEILVTRIISMEQIEQDF
jgi:hypothetical protein